MKVIIFGIGDLAKQLHYYINQLQEYNVEYFCVNKEYFSCDKFLDKDVITFEEDLKSLSSKEYKFIIAVGYKKLRMRKKIFDMIKKEGFDLINYISPKATVLGDVVGEGNIILSNVVIEPFTKIHNNNIIWSNSLLCHDVIVGNHNFIAAGSIVGGFSQIVESNFLGFNSTIKDNIVVEREVLVGAKSLIVNPPENYSMYYGTPAKKVRTHYETGIVID